MAKLRRVPTRMCIACRQMFDKKQLLRIVRTTDGEIKVDYTGKLNGRGAYLCKSTACLAKCVKSNALGRQLESQISEETIKQITKAIEQ